MKMYRYLNCRNYWNNSGINRLTASLPYCMITISSGQVRQDSANITTTLVRRDEYMDAKKGILVVSFGTSHPTTRAATIDAIEDSISTVSYTHLDVYKRQIQYNLHGHCRCRTAAPYGISFAIGCRRKECLHPRKIWQLRD